MVTTLRPYQQDIFNAVAQSIAQRKGLTFSVEMARQGGKNEVSAHLEQSVLITQMSQARDLIKCSPTFVPQALISMKRLKSRLDEDGFAGQWTSERGYMIGLGRARSIFLSADESSRVVGHTAHLLLEIDESQDVNREKYSKEFKPMASTTNATTVLYGTAWDDSTLLEETKQTNLELERKDGIKRHFGYDWQVVAKHNADYLRFVESERDRLGEDHPLFRTQYRLLPVRAGGGFLSAVQRTQMQGDHPRLHCPQPGSIYVAGIDIAGEAEELEDNILTSLKPRQDSTVVTIAEISQNTPECRCEEPQRPMASGATWQSGRPSPVGARHGVCLKNRHEKRSR